MTLLFQRRIDFTNPHRKAQREGTMKIHRKGKLPVKKNIGSAMIKQKGEYDPVDPYKEKQS